jgi:hypothetical protein
MQQQLRKEKGQFMSQMALRSSSMSMPLDEVRGYRVLAFGTSKDTWTGSLGPIDVELKKRHSVFIVGLKTFPHHTAAMEWDLAREPGDP